MFVPQPINIAPTQGLKDPDRGQIISFPDSILENWLVITPEIFNAHHGYFLGLPMTRERSKGNPFEFPVDQHNVKGIVLTHQLQPVPYRHGQLVLHCLLNKTDFVGVIETLEAIISYRD